MNRNKQTTSQIKVITLTGLGNNNTCNHIIPLRFALLMAVLLGITCGNAFGRDFKADFKKVQDAYALLDNFKANATLKVYQANASTPIITRDISISIHNGNAYHITYGHLDMLLADSVMIVANRQTQRLTYSLYDSLPGIYQMANKNIDSICAHYDSVACRGTHNGLIRYTIYTPGDMIEQTEMYIHANTYLIAKIQYQYNNALYQGQRAEIRYYDMNQSPSFAPGTFSLKQYIRQENGGIKPAKQYAGYELIFVNELMNEYFYK